MPKKIGIFSWDFLGIFLGCPKKTWDFLGFSWDCFGIRKSGIFLGFLWDFARLLEYSDIIYVSLRRFWILLLRALVTHTYNTYERLFRHGDVFWSANTNARAYSGTHTQIGFNNIIILPRPRHQGEGLVFSGNNGDRGSPVAIRLSSSPRSQGCDARAQSMEEAPPTCGPNTEDCVA